MTIMNGQFIEDEQYLGRSVKNALGVDETVTLPARHWKHFDWLASHGFDMDKWTAQLDLGRHEYSGFEISFSAYLEMQLVKDEAHRHRKGEPVPLHINPHRPL